MSDRVRASNERTDEVSMMLPLHPLATAVQADREREIRDRSPLRIGLASGPRHPAGPETDVAAAEAGRDRRNHAPAPRPAVAFGEGG
jgi:hypothetical protein